MATTLTRRYPTQPVTGVFRRHPELRWTDAAGDHTFHLTSRAIVGSASGNEVVVADAAVSRIHAELDPRPEGVWIHDLGSHNGSFVDGVRVTGALIHPLAVVTLGGTSFKVDYGVRPTRVQIWPEDRFGPLVGATVVMRDLFAQLAKVAATDSSVLITGETGTGKELVARAIHEASTRAAEPFIVVDCASLTETLLESELFGHAKGAFTGAVSARAGAFELASGGTVFLDEIGELPLSMQPKLLRVLESRTIRRIGESEHRKVDMRLVTATHRDLRHMVNEGAFREDLYFRLAVLPIAVPPLRERLADIPLLIEHLFPGRGADQLGTELLAELLERPWLGNVRELRNFVERAMAFGPEEARSLSRRETRRPTDLDPPSSQDAASSRRLPPLTGRPTALLPEAPPAAISFETTLKEFREQWSDQGDREYIRRLLERHGGSVSSAAAEAGVDRTYLYRCIRKLRSE
ncbi:MAG: sigma 54-interacting transcriptional regulator [Byssovorax sp.]